MYTYRATCTKVIDGDTVELDVDLGFHTSITIRGRLHNVNAPELFTGTNRENGLKAKEYLETLVTGRPLVVTTYKDHTSFGRWIVEIIAQGRLVNEQIQTFCDKLS